MPSSASPCFGSCSALPSGPDEVPSSPPVRPYRPPILALRSVVSPCRVSRDLRSPSSRSGSALRARFRFLGFPLPRELGSTAISLCGPSFHLPCKDGIGTLRFHDSASVRRPCEDRFVPLDLTALRLRVTCRERITRARRNLLDHSIQPYPSPSRIGLSKIDRRVSRRPRQLTSRNQRTFTTI